MSAARAADLAASAALREAVTVEAIFRHLRALQDIAARHGGHRAAGSPGYDASAAYVAAALRGAGYAVVLQEFSFPFFEATAPPVLSLGDGAEGAVARGKVRTFFLSGAGEVTGAVQPVDFAAPAAANTSTSGCEAADFAGFAPGAIALLRRGTCPFQAKVANAIAAGAAGVIIANDGAAGRTGAFPGRLTGAAGVPVVSVSAAAGERLATRASRSGKGGATVRLAVAARTATRSTRNVIAEMAGGDPARVIVVGAHLDGVPAGPGINDNGSGVAVVLETALQLARLGIAPTNRVRFAFWRAEEIGLLGSRHHVAGLAARDRGRIVAALNFDMVGSPNFGRFIYDGDGSAMGRAGPDGSAAIERVFEAYFRAVGLAPEPTALHGDGSDHAPFVAAGIAAGGLYTGGGEEKSAAQAELFGGAAGRRFDPCQHRGCDTVANVSARAIDEMADAAAHAVLTLALDRDLPVRGMDEPRW